jgi:transposase
MAQRDGYFRFSRISEATLGHWLRCFAFDLTATQAAEMTGLSIGSVNDIYLRLRRKIAEEWERRSPFGGVLEADESYFGPQRVRGKRGRGASGKSIVLGLLKRGDPVYTEIVPDASKATLQAILRGKAGPQAVLHTDGWRGYDGLVDRGFDKHVRVSHGESEFASGNNHINGIESFWSLAKQRLVQFHALPKHTFYLHLKESESDSTKDKNNLYKVLLSFPRKEPL